MSRLKIVHAAKFYPPVRGGMERVVGDLCNGTAGAWDVRVVAANTRARTVEERCGDVEVVRAAAFGSRNSVPLCPSLPSHLWRTRADCVVLHEPNPIAGSALFLRTPARRLVVWHHSDLVRPWWAPHTYGRVQRALYRRAECVIVSSPNLAADSWLVQQARRVVVIPFGISIDRYRHIDDAQRATANRIRATTTGPRVLFVGRFVYYKGVELLIDAIARCSGTLLLIGEGPLEPELRERAGARGLQDRVVFLGRVPDEELPAYYHASDLFVLPSVARTEAFGVVQVEAMAAGVPVISTNLPTGVPWVNQDGVSGLVVPPGDAEALATAIGRVLGDAELRGRLGRNAARRAREMFSRDRMVDAFRETVERAVHAPDLAAKLRLKPPRTRSNAGARNLQGHPSQENVLQTQRVSALEISRPACRARGGVVTAKRTLDVLLSLVGLLLSAPLWAVIAAAIKIESPGGPVFFKQARVGEHGRTFDALKFRSMIPDAERGVGPVQATAHDPRVTRVGRVLRATAMDELPQLWNIFRGDMSFVGPRALRPDEIEVGAGGATVPIHAIPGFIERSAVPPGLTGIAQIYAPRDVSRRQKFRLDVLYIRRRSFLLDLRLILVSFWITLRGTWEQRDRKF